MRHREQDDLRRQPEGFKQNYLDNVSTAGINTRQLAQYTYHRQKQILQSIIYPKDMWALNLFISKHINNLNPRIWASH